MSDELRRQAGFAFAEVQQDDVIGLLAFEAMDRVFFEGQPRVAKCNSRWQVASTRIASITMMPRLHADGAKEGHDVGR